MEMHGPNKPYNPAYNKDIAGYEPDNLINGPVYIVRGFEPIGKNIGILERGAILGWETQGENAGRLVPIRDGNTPEKKEEEEKKPPKNPEVEATYILVAEIDTTKESEQIVFKSGSFNTNELNFFGVDENKVKYQLEKRSIYITASIKPEYF